MRSGKLPAGRTAGLDTGRTAGRSAVLAAILAGVLLGGACVERVVEPSAVGAVEGSVVITAAVGEAQSTISLYPSLGDLELRTNGTTVPLTGNGIILRFRFDDIPVGTYYAEACFHYGCGHYRTPAGEPRALTVQSGRLTIINIAL